MEAELVWWLGKLSMMVCLVAGRLGCGDGNSFFLWPAWALCLQEGYRDIGIRAYRPAPSSIELDARKNR